MNFLKVILTTFLAKIKGIEPLLLSPNQGILFLLSQELLTLVVLAAANVKPFFLSDK